MKSEGLTGEEISLNFDETNMGLNGYNLEFVKKEKPVIKTLKNNA